MSYTLIIPIYNEERTVPSLINKLNQLNSQIEVIIIDDGSNDDTNNLLIQNNNFTIIRNKINQGKGNAIKKGISKAANQNIIIMDGDLEVDFNDIPMLIEKYEENNCNPLVGIRWGHNKYYPNIDLNFIGNYLINKLFNFLYKSNFNDVLCCVKILNTNLFKSLLLKSDGFNIEAEIMAKLILKNQDVDELQINYNRRTITEGKKLRFSDSWSIIYTILKLRIL